MPFDVVAILAAALLALFGSIKGLARIVLLAAGLGAAWFVALQYTDAVAVRLGAARAQPAHGIDLHRIAAFALVFAGVMAVSGLVGWIVTKALGAVHLRWLDRCAGAGMGLMAAILLLSAATIPLSVLSGDGGASWARGSVLAPYALAGGEFLESLVPEPARARFRAVARPVLTQAPGRT